MLFLHLAFAASVSFAQFEPLKDFNFPLKKLSASEIPVFNDDDNLRDLETAIQRQLVRYQTRDLSGKIMMGGHRYPQRLAKESLQVFLQLVRNFNTCSTNTPVSLCFERLNVEIRNRFDVFAPDLQPGDPRYGEANDSLFTGYHTHLIEAKSRPTGAFKYPIYKKPNGQAQFFTRDEIDFQGKLKNKGLELGYTDNLFDLYLLHVQGGGYVRVEENNSVSSFYLGYRASNNHRWQWISKYMKDKGYISNSSNAAQRKFLNANPSKHREIYSTNPNYIYYVKTTTSPVGSDTVPVTGGRTIATDSSLYGFKGLITYVESERPVDTGTYDMEQEDATQIPYQPFSRFLLDQDTGGAIDGKGRADIYFGQSHYAYYAASYQQKTGKLRYLMLKDPGP